LNIDNQIVGEIQNLSFSIKSILQDLIRKKVITNNM